MTYKAIVIGASAGGMTALRILLTSLPRNFSAAVIVVQHVSSRSDNYMVRYLNDNCIINVKEADEKEKIVCGKVYFAPPNYHLLIEDDETFSLTIDEPYNYARPSIDILFETASEVYTNQLIGVILTGANHDGSQGLKKIKEYGGLTIVQDPQTAEFTEMPTAALQAIDVDDILSLEKIGPFLKKLIEGVR